MSRAIGNALGWQLPGSAVKSRGNETLEDAAFRIIKRDIPKIEIGELHPIAYIEKKYIFSGKSIVHRGITFMGRVRNLTQKDVEKQEEIKGRFIPIDSSQEVARIEGADKQIFNIAYKMLRGHIDVSSDSIDNEITSSNQLSLLTKWFHENLIRPLGRPFSSKIIKNAILNYVKQDHYVLDVACGDDDFIFELAKKAKFCVGNDIRWDEIINLRDLSFTNSERKDLAKRIIFTNHDACQLPFTKKFDLTICKNLLHHISSKDQLTCLLESLNQVSHQILIVDPEDPLIGPIEAKFWHWYYVNILKDQGEQFLNYDKFQKIIRDYFNEPGQCKFEIIRTAKGKYMLANIKTNSNNLNVNK